MEDSPLIHVAKDLFQLVCENWLSATAVESKAGSRRFPPMEDGCAGMNGLMKKLQRMMTVDQYPQAPKPRSFELCGSSMRGTALRHGSDLDVMFIFDLPVNVDEFQLEPEEQQRKLVANTLYHSHRSLSRAVRSVGARAGGVIFQYYIREGSDVKGCGSRISFKGWEIDCVVVVNDVSIPCIQRLTSYRSRPDLSASDRQVCSALLPKLQPTLLYVHYRKNIPPLLSQTAAAAARVVKLWWRICAGLFSDSEEMTQGWRCVWMGASDMNEDIFPEDIRSKTQTGLGGSELEAVVLEAEKLLQKHIKFLTDTTNKTFTMTVEALVVHAWRLLASGWVPPTLDRLDTTMVGVSMNRLSLVIKEHLMARATLAVYNQCMELNPNRNLLVEDRLGLRIDSVTTRSLSVVLPTLVAVAALKHVDFDAAQDSIGFDSDILATDVEAVREEMRLTASPGSEKLTEQFEKHFKDKNMPLPAWAQPLNIGKDMRKSRQRYAKLLVDMEMNFEIQFWSSRHEFSLLENVCVIANKAIAAVRKTHMFTRAMQWPKILDELRRGINVGTSLRPRRLRKRGRNELGDGGFVVQGFESLTIIAQMQTAADSLVHPFLDNHAGGRPWPEHAHSLFDPLGESFYRLLIASTVQAARENVGPVRGVFILHPWIVFGCWCSLGAAPETGTFADTVMPRGVCRCAPGTGCKRHIFQGQGIHTIDGRFHFFDKVVSVVFDDSCYRFPSAAEFDTEFRDKVCFKKSLSRCLPKSLWGYFSGHQPLFYQESHPTPPPCVCLRCRKEWTGIFSKPIPSNLEPRVKALFRELLEISSSDVTHAHSELREAFLSEKTEPRTKEIGLELHEIGDLKLMQEAFTIIPKYDHGSLQWAFHGVGNFAV